MALVVSISIAIGGICARRTVHEVEKLVDDLRVVVRDSRGAQERSERLGVGWDIGIGLVLSVAFVIDGSAVFILDVGRCSKMAGPIHDEGLLWTARSNSTQAFNSLIETAEFRYLECRPLFF